MIRALEEMEIEGVATTIPADLVILRHPDFVNGTHSTRWVEDTLDLSEVAAPVAPAPPDDGDPLVRRDVDVEVDGRRFSVSVWVPVSAGAPAARPTAGAPAARPRRAASAGHSGGAAGSGNVTVPMQGTIVKVLVAVGDAVEIGTPVCVLEAMKMENNIPAEKSGTIAEVRVTAGQSVGTGDIVATIE